MEDKGAEISLSIVIPVYKSEEILPKLVKEIYVVMQDLALENSFELLLVNDGSPDRSWDAICEQAARCNYVKGISLRRNFGQHSATMAGLNCSLGDFVIIMDDDLQHPPVAIGNMLSALKEGHDVCYTKYLNRQHPMWKKIGSKVNDWVATRLLGKPKGLYLSSFKAIRRDVVDEIIQYNGPYAYIDGLILDVTRSITTVEVEHQEREIGQGNYNILSSFSLWLKMATSFSVVPLRFASYTGLSLAIISMIMIVIVIIQKILNPDLQAGWSSVIATILFIGGVQMLYLGLIGEYMGRAYLKLNGKPQYSVGATVNLGRRAK